MLKTDKQNQSHSHEKHFYLDVMVWLKTVEETE